MSNRPNCPAAPTSQTPPAIRENANPDTSTRHGQPASRLRGDEWVAPPGIWNPRLSLPALALMILAAAGSNAAETTRHFLIPPQPLSSALMALAKDSNLELVYKTEKVRGLASRGVDGHMTATQALQRLLQGTGLAYRFMNEHSVTIESGPNDAKPERTDSESRNPAVRPEEPKVLPKVKVTAKAEVDHTDPYDTSYVIPSATAGTKTDTPIMETPLNVQVISKQVLKDQQVIRLADSFKNVSGVVTRSNTVSSGILGGSSQNIFLRGFESSTFFRNGFRIEGGSASKGMANVESVEVLKGPAAILYGAVEPGGMVNVITKQPLATPYYGFTQQFGSYDLYRTTLDATGPLTQAKDLLYRVNMSYENSGSFRDLVGKEDVFFNPVLKWVISPRTQATFEVEYDHNHLATDSALVRTALNGTPLKEPFSRNYGGYSPITGDTIFGGLNWSHQFNDDWMIKHRFSVNQSSSDSPHNIRAQGVASKSFWTTNLTDLAIPLLSSQPEGDYVVRTDQYSPGTGQTNVYSTNLDLVGHFDTLGLKHTLLTGGDFYRTDSKSHDPDTFISFVSLRDLHARNPAKSFLFSGANGSSKVDQYGLYIQDQIKLPYGFQVMGGIRWQYIHQADNSPSASTQDAVTPRVGLLWQPQSWLSLYANYTESFNANTGKTFVRPGVGAIIAPTSASQYEGGVKFQFFDNKLRGTLAYYDLTKTNIAIGDPNLQHDCGAGPVPNCSLAIGEIRSRGPELDITGEILPGWNVIGTWANTDIRVTKSNANNDALPSGNDGTPFAPGDRVPNVPRNIGSLWSTYEVEDSDFKGLTFGGGATLRDGALAFGFVNNPGVTYKKYPGYATFSLMAGYNRQIGGAKVSVQLNVDNLLDKRAFNSVLSQGGFGGAWVDFVQPRTLMGQVSIQY